jgi:hypothetical protein
MIAADKDIANEEFELDTMESNSAEWESNAYDWVT